MGIALQANPTRLDYSITAASYNALPIAFSAWIKVDDLPDTGNIGYFANVRASSYGTAQLGRVFFCTKGTGNTFVLNVLCGRGAGAFNSASLTNALNYGQWYHIVLVMKSTFAADATQCAMFVNGVNAAVTTGTNVAGSAITTDGLLEMGDRDGGDDRQFIGMMEDACLWNRNISESEAAAIMAARTETQFAALSFTSSLLGRAKFRTNSTYEESLGAYPLSNPLTATVTGTTALQNYGNLPESTRCLIGNYYASTSDCYTDAGTTPVAATGDAVYQWTDRSLCALATQTTAANRPQFLAATGRPASVTFDAGAPAGAQWMALATAPQYHTQNLTVLLFGRTRGIGLATQQTVFGGANAEAVFGTTGLIRASGTNTGIYGCDTPSMFGWSMGPSAFVGYRDGESSSASAIASAGSTAGYLGRAQASASRFANLEANQIVIIQEPLTAAQMAEMWSYGQSQFGLRTKTGDCILVGASSMVGYYGLYTRDIAYVMQPTFPNVRFFNCAKDGTTTSDTITARTQVSAIVTAQLARTGKYPSVLVQCGSNDIYASGDTPATVSGNIDTLLGYYVGYGVSKIGLLPILPRGTVGSADNDDRVALNALLRLKNRPVAVSDQDSRLADGAQTATTYYYSGEASPRTHLNFTGMGIVAGYVANVVRRLIGGSGRARARRLVSATGRARP